MVDKLKSLRRKENEYFYAVFFNQELWLTFVCMSPFFPLSLSFRFVLFGLSCRVAFSWIFSSVPYP